MQDLLFSGTAKPLTVGPLTVNRGTLERWNAGTLERWNLPMADQTRRRDWFTTTRWTLVLEVADTKSPHGREALEDLCECYWYSLYVYVRRRGYGQEEAQDLTQGFFAQLLGRRYIKAADP